MIEAARRRRALEHRRAPKAPRPSVSRVATDSSATTRTLARGRVRRDRLGLLHFVAEQRALAQPRAADAVRQE